MPINYKHTELKELLEPLFTELEAKYSTVFNRINSKNVLFVLYNPPAMRFSFKDPSVDYVIVSLKELTSNFPVNEQYAIILHEVGHILDESVDHQVDREYNADSFVAAISTHYKDNLKSALRRMRETSENPSPFNARLMKLAD